MMDYYVCFIGLVIMISASPVHSRSGGAPVEACSDLIPQHGGNSNQTGPSPFELNVGIFEDLADPDLMATYSYKPGNSYNLILRVSDPASGLTFRGFFIQARLVADDSDIGGFIYPVNGEYRLSSCSPPTLGATHINSSNKSSIMIRWTAPPLGSGPILFRYSFVQSFTTFWADLRSVNIIERRCDIEIGPYFDSTTGNCTFSCPIGYRGVYATGTCDALPAGYGVSFTADTYFQNFDTSIQNRSTVFNFTAVVGNGSLAMFISLNILKNARVERIFKFSNGAVSRDYSVNPQESDGQERLIRERVIVINDPMNPIETGLYDFNIIVTTVGISPLRISRATAIGLVQVMDPCVGQPCRNQGTCMASGGSFICTCATYFTGTNCETRINACDDPSTVQCINGTCIDSIGSYSCQCFDGYTGSTCDTEIDDCTPNLCQNGTCMDEVNAFTCSCYLGWTGRYCETDIDYCDTCTGRLGPCEESSSNACIDGNSTYSCSCLTGFTGRNCSIDIDDCVAMPCLNGGTCTNLQFGLIQCQCAEGFTGSTCGTALLCESDPCSNNGTCTDLGNGDFRCDCPGGFTGERCLTDIEVCTETSCQNGGTCVEGIGLDFSCMCLPGYTAATCQEEILQCMPDTCRNGGTCMEGIGLSFSCLCPEGFTGISCEIDESFCTPTTCLNGGTCIEEVGTQTRCMCADGFTDLDCGIDLPDCRPDTCLNGGTCMEGIGSATSCTCPHGFSGDDCGTDLPFCQVDSCLNGGTCIEGVGNLTTCRCLDGFTGGSCQRDMEFCTNETCQNGGTCEEGIGTSTSCICPSDFTGSNCEIGGEVPDDLTPTVRISTVALGVIIIQGILLITCLIINVVVLCCCLVACKTRKRTLTPVVDPIQLEMHQRHESMESIGDYSKAPLDIAALSKESVEETDNMQLSDEDTKKDLSEKIKQCEKSQ